LTEAKNNPFYFSAQGFALDVETHLHECGIMTNDLETWEK
jgi:hypothetical protein